MFLRTRCKNLLSLDPLSLDNPQPSTDVRETIIFYYWDNLQLKKSIFLRYRYSTAPVLPVVKNFHI